MKKTIATIENKITGTKITHVRLSDGVISVNVQSEWYDNDEMYQSKYPSFLDNLRQLFKNLHK